MKILEANNVAVNEIGGGFVMKFVTDEGDFCIDHRAKTETRGRLYKGFPLEDKNLLSPSKAKKFDKKLVEALKEWKKKIAQDFMDNRKKDKN